MVWLFALAWGDPVDADGDTIADGIDRCPALGDAFGDRGAVAGVDGSMPPSEAELRGLTGCPYMEVLGCGVWDADAVRCVATAIDQEVLTAIDANQRMPVSDVGRYEVLLDGVEDETKPAKRIYRSTQTSGPSAGFIREGDDAVRALRAHSRSRVAVEAFRGRYPSIPASTGMVHLGEPQGHRGIWLVIAPDYRSVRIEVIEPPPPPPEKLTLPSTPEVSEVVRVGPVFGYGRRHQRHLTAVGLSIGLDPAWAARISFEIAYMSMFSAAPLYTSRLDTTQRLDQLDASVRWTVLRRVASPFVALGGLSVPAIVPIAPRGEIGVSWSGRRLSMELATMLSWFPEDKLGHLGGDVVLRVRAAIPLEKGRR